MTNKRKHQLERKVRMDFNNFNKIIYPKELGIALLEQITRLILDRIKLLKYTGRLTVIEAYFTSECVRTYYWHYIKLMDNFYD